MLLYFTLVVEGPSVVAEDVPSEIVTISKEAFPMLPKPTENYRKTKEEESGLLY